MCLWHVFTLHQSIKQMPFPNNNDDICKTAIAVDVLLTKVAWGEERF